ncbi:MAG: hypothetical protein R2770_19890 [Acidimicrobiales bacterium]
MNPTELEVLFRPLSARSVMASALLGSRPPRLRGRLLIALVEQFGIAPGTARVALSRMVEKGELVNDDGMYALSGELLKRQRRQDLARSSASSQRDGRWDGAWEQAIVAESGRTAAKRHALRRDLGAARLGELREGVWMRPGNLDREVGDLLDGDVANHVLWFRVSPSDTAAAGELVGRLFALDAWSDTAAELLGQLQGSAGDLAARFRLAAAVLQHLTHDPLLPIELYPPGWPADQLRQAYARYEADLQVELRSFFAAVGA